MHAHRHTHTFTLTDLTPIHRSLSLSQSHSLSVISHKEMIGDAFKLRSTDSLTHTRIYTFAHILTLSQTLTWDFQTHWHLHTLRLFQAHWHFHEHTTHTHWHFHIHWADTFSHILTLSSTHTDTFGHIQISKHAHTVTFTHWPYHNQKHWTFWATGLYLKWSACHYMLHNIVIKNLSFNRIVFQKYNI